MSRCRSCGAPVVWARTPLGKRVPLDAEPNPEGNIELIDGVAVVRSQASMFTGDRYMPHFATCPDAADWRSHA